MFQYAGQDGSLAVHDNGRELAYLEYRLGVFRDPLGLRGMGYNLSLFNRRKRFRLEDGGHIHIAMHADPEITGLWENGEKRVPYV